MVDSNKIGQLAAAAVAGVVTFVVAAVLFGVIPQVTSVGPLQILLILLVPLVAMYVAAQLAGKLLTEYNTAKVSVEGVIQKTDGGTLQPGPDVAASDEIVEQIEQADADSDAEALVVELNTPGGMPVASHDVREATEKFDGPTFAYTHDLCASGGYVIACGCEDVFARENSIVGSIGVNANQRKFHDLADEYGITNERFAGGKYKDTLDPLKELSDDEREYFQGVIDSSYENFVEMVAESRDLDPEVVSDTEARVYHAPDALEAGLVDHVGSHREFESLVEDRLDDEEMIVEEFEPERGIREQLSMSAMSVAYAFGQGLASVVSDRKGALVEFRQ